MASFAAVVTGRGSGAIATIQLLGDTAETVLTKAFRREGGKPFEAAVGRILLGHIVDGDEAVDQVTLGCEGPGLFAIHCHGNPLIVERIMGLLQGQGATLLTAEQMLVRILAAEASHDSIAGEVRLAMTTVKTIEGAEILARQVESGLSARVRQWQRALDVTPLEQIAAEADQILRDSVPARLIVAGCTIALIGPPGTGKSTLLNTLAGRDKAVVTGVRGTTRDWVCAEIHIPPLAATVIDTAGLDATLAANRDIDQAAQRKSLEVLARADLALLVLDASEPADQLLALGEISHRGHRDHRERTDPLAGPSLIPLSVSSVAKDPQACVQRFWDVLAGKRSVVVLNKVDLPPRLDGVSVPVHLGPTVRISARQGTGIEDLIQAIHQTLGTTALDARTAVAFTPRQWSLLEQLRQAPSKSEARRITSQLLTGPLTV